MAHTYVTKNLVTFISAEAFGGTVGIREPDGEQVIVRMEDILEFVAEYVKFQRCEHVPALKALEG